ncbi:MAG: tetratricopeptide repeat protein [Alphaproteobacteria bacterium]|nr:tetratricopeptide repeat protein [Alphaproteobacteria bacterium]
MQENGLTFPQEIYFAQLTSLNGIKLSKREIDIISCILNGRSAKGIAHLLSIAPKTVEVHTYNVMKKLSCSSREGLISLAEKSDKLLLLKRYYLRLLSHLAFEQSLKNISKLGSHEEKSCVIICWKKEETIALLSQIRAHLELAGVKTSFEVRENGESSLDLTSKKRSSYCTLYALSKEWARGKEKLLSFFKKLTSPSSHILFLVMDKETLSYLSPSIEGDRYINFAGKENYYFSIFTVLKRLFPQRNFDPLIEEFKKKHQLMTHSSEVTSPLRPSTLQKGSIVSHLMKYLKQGKWFLVALLLVCGGVLVNQGLQKEKELIEANDQHPEISREDIVRSDLNLPSERVLLKRSELMGQIDDRLKGDSGIQTIALIGMGGAGKTTLARHYVHQQKANVVWEINAETYESLQESFNHLAQALAKTEEDQKKLRELQGLKDSIEREERVVLFVKERLKSLSNWFLLYDNVEHFTDIQNHFPQDVATWGQGKIIITTRDDNIRNHTHVNNVVHIGELSSDQKQILFAKIMNHGRNTPLISSQLKEIKAYLDHIPSFPLDVSTAAYYIKATNIPYGAYLKNLAEYNKDFSDVQENLLKEVGDYPKTRYGIITLSLQHLINTDENFKDLLLFISILDSQNIPRKLLEDYKNSVIVDSFIYHLKKHSLIIDHNNDSNIFIHRSTQKICLSYLVNLLNLEKDTTSIQLLSKTLESYISNAIDRDEYSVMELLVSHCEKFLSHSHILPNSIKGAITGELGAINYNLGKDLKAKQLLEESLIALNKYDKQSYGRIARFMAYLGSVHGFLGNHMIARELLEKSLVIYQEKLPESYDKAAWALIKLGMIHGRVGNYNKAKELLEKSLVVNRKYFPINQFNIAQASTHLGIVYSTLGNYEKAKRLFEESFIIYKKQFGATHPNSLWNLVYLGNIYKELGEYEKARKIVEYSLGGYEKQFSENSPNIAWILIDLGNIYANLGNYERAKHLLQRSLMIHENNYGKDNVKTMQVLRDLGQVYLLEGQVDTAEDLINKALSILQRSNHLESYKCLEILSDLYYKKSIQVENKEDIKQFQNFKKKALLYLKQSLKVANTYFPENSPHIIRIHDKLKNLNKK